MLGGRERLWVSPPRGPGRPPTLPETPFTGRQVPSGAGPAKPSPHAPLRPLPRARQPANHTRSTLPSRFQGVPGRARFRSQSPWRAGTGSAAPSTSPGAGNGGVRLPGANSESLPGGNAPSPTAAGLWRGERRK